MAIANRISVKNLIVEKEHLLSNGVDVENLVTEFIMKEISVPGLHLYPEKVILSFNGCDLAIRFTQYKEKAMNFNTLLKELERLNLCAKSDNAIIWSDNNMRPLSLAYYDEKKNIYILI